MRIIQKFNMGTYEQDGFGTSFRNDYNKEQISVNINGNVVKKIIDHKENSVKEAIIKNLIDKNQSNKVFQDFENDSDATQYKLIDVKKFNVCSDQIIK